MDDLYHFATQRAGAL